MIKHKVARKKLRELLNGLDPKHDKITFEMSRFRHAVYNTTDKCYGIIDVDYFVFPKEELLACRFKFNNKFVTCTCDHKTGVIKVVDSTKDGAIMSTYEEMPEVVKSLQPKLKAVIKVKKAV